MLSSVLKSGRAIAVNIQIMRASSVYTSCSSRTESSLKIPISPTRRLAAILSAIRELMNPTTPKHRSIGFAASLDEK
jgi:hypothetical protein